MSELQLKNMCESSFQVTTYENSSQVASVHSDFIQIKDEPLIRNYNDRYNKNSQDPLVHSGFIRDLIEIKDEPFESNNEDSQDPSAHSESLEDFLQVKGEPFESSNEDFQYPSVYSESIEDLIEIKDEPFEDQMQDDDIELETSSDTESTYEPPHSKTFTCDICDKVFIIEKCFKNHMTKNHSENLNFCKYCGLSFEDNENLNNHIKTHDKNTPYTCKFCGDLFSTNILLKEHISFNHEIKCDYCKHVSSSKEALKAHLNADHSKCKYCSDKLDTFKELQEHIESIHSGDRKFKCNKCGKLFETKPILFQHLQIHNTERKFECTFCDKKFHWKWPLVLHIRSHTNERPHPCTKCTKSFKCQYRLKLHNNAMHPDENAVKKHTCTLCEKEYSQKCHLTDHMLKHTGHKKFRCPECDNIFVYHIDFRLHFECHVKSEDKKVKCNQCDEMVSNESILKLHVHEKHRKHKKSRYECKVCNKTYSYLSAFHHHRKMCNVSGQKVLPRFECEECKKVYPYASSLYNHRKQCKGFEHKVLNECVEDSEVKPKKPRRIYKKSRYECKECKKVYPYAGSLYNHRKQCKGFEENKLLNVKPKPKRIYKKSRYECQECKKVYPYASSLYNHRKQCKGFEHKVLNASVEDSQVKPKPKRIYKKSRFECKECKKVYPYAGSLYNHRKQCKGSSSVVFDSPEEQEIHSKTHISEHQVVNECVECSVVFHSPEELEKHSKTHIKLKDFNSVKCNSPENNFFEVKMEHFENSEDYV